MITSPQTPLCGVYAMWKQMGIHCFFSYEINHSKWDGFSFFVIFHLLMCGDVEKQLTVLRCRVFGSVRRREAHCQHDRLPLILMFWLAQKRNRVIGYQIWIIILSESGEINSIIFCFPFTSSIHLCIIETVFDLLSIHINGVVIILGILYQSSPFSPAGRYVRTIVFVQILSEISYRKKNGSAIVHLIRSSFIHSDWSISFIH